MDLIDDGMADLVGTSSLPILGNGTHSLDALQLRLIGGTANGLNIPRDLAFNPDVEGQLWVVNRGNETMVVFSNVDTDNPTSQAYHGLDSGHFFAQPSALAWGKDDTFATIHETDDPTQGSYTPPDFMGPVLQWANLSIFDAGWTAHLDMLHNSPNGMGIAWERENIYWIFDGYHSSITRYDFATDHGPGGSDHTDAVIMRYVEGEVRWLENVPSHMEYDHSSDLLYISDTGNNRIAVFNVNSGSAGFTLQPDYDWCTQFYMNGAEIWTLIDGPEIGLEAPSGLALHDGLIYITDNITSIIYAFTTDGVLVDWLETGFPSGALMGISFDTNGMLYLVDAVGHHVYELSPIE
jgi:hypothetical protein